MAEVGDGITEELICSICLNQYVNPKCLPCAHSFCEKCLQSEIVAAVDRRSTEEEGFHCPVCQKFTNPPRPSLPMSQWVANFPTNTALNNIIEKLANNCPYHKTQERTLFCFRCEALLCTTCAWESHKECLTVLPLEDASIKAKSLLKMYIKELEVATVPGVPSEDSLTSKLKQLDEMNAFAEQSIKDSATAIILDINRREEDLLRKLNLKHTERRQMLRSLISSRQFVSRAKIEINNYVTIKNKIDVLERFQTIRNSCSRAKTNVDNLFAFDMDPNKFHFPAYHIIRNELVSRSKTCHTDRPLSHSLGKKREKR